VFLAFVIDVFSRPVVGWQLASHMRASLVCDALKMAVSTRPRGADVELVHHSDRGSQDTSIEFAQVLDDHEVLQSVGSVGDAYDNALAESFVDTIKTELVADRVWQTRTQLELALVEYLGWFNDARLHESLGDLPPADFEALYALRDETSTTTIKISRQQSRCPRNPARLRGTTSTKTGMRLSARSSVSHVGKGPPSRTRIRADGRDSAIVWTTGGSLFPARADTSEPRRQMGGRAQARAAFIVMGT